MKNAIITDKDIADKDSKFLSEINYLFGQRTFKFFMSEMSDIPGYGFELVDKPKGEKQSIYAIDYYVDQRRCYEADDFEGECYLRLANNKYLK